MTTIDSPGAKTARRRKMAGVTATALAAHLGVSRQYVARLADEGTIARQGDGLFDQDACRLRYLNWLRDPARRAVRSEADSKFTEAKTRLLEIRMAEKLGELVPKEASDAALDAFTAAVFAELHAISARAAPVDIVWRRKIDAAVLVTRKAIHARLAAKVEEFEREKGDHDD